MTVHNMTLNDGDFTRVLVDICRDDKDHPYLNARLVKKDPNTQNKDLFASDGSYVTEKVQAVILNTMLLSDPKQHTYDLKSLLHIVQAINESNDCPSVYKSEKDGGWYVDFPLAPLLQSE